MRSVWVVVGVTLAGCMDPLEERPWVFDETDPPLPSASVETVTAEVQAALDALVGVSAQPVLAAYDAAMQSRSEGCPTYYAADDAESTASQWYDLCRSEEGGAFDGYGFDETTAYEEGSLTQRLRVVSMSGRITTADGHVFEGGGSAYHGTGADDGVPYAFSGVFGAFAWDGPGADGTWLGDGHQLDLQVIRQDASFGKVFQASGAFVTGGGAAVSFDAFTLVEEACAGEPAGGLSVRGEDGWYDVVFDLQLEGPTDPAACDGCGLAWYRGEPVGSVCVDTSALLDFDRVDW